jgi:isopentenyldiphosphate isomerase
MFRGNDILKIYDDDYNNTGRATREEVHQKGLLHQVAHLWMFQQTGDETYILFQQRSLKRELHPGQYDLIQTTHFDPEESYEEAIVHSMDYYLGAAISLDAIIHIGSTRQHIDQGDYHDNALVQVFVVSVSKALFIMPDTEEIIKVRYQDFCDLVRRRTDHIQIFSLDDYPLKETSRDEWWIRENEFFDVLEPYIDAKLKFQ